MSTMDPFERYVRGLRCDEKDVRIAELEARVAALEGRAERIKEAIDKGIKETWHMIDPFNPPPAGSYSRGSHEGIAGALRTVRMNIDRAIAATEPSSRTSE